MIKRWNGYYDEYEDFEDINGPYVLYSDHISELEKAKQEKVCEWIDIFDEDENPVYETECGRLFFDKFKYCPYCGGKIQIEE